MYIPVADTKGFAVTSEMQLLSSVLGQDFDLSAAAFMLQNKDEANILYVAYKPGAVAPTTADALEISAKSVGPFAWPREVLPSLWVCGDASQNAVLQQMSER